MDVASVLRAARRRSGLTKRALARRAHTSAAALVEYEKNRRSPSVSTLERVLHAAGVDADIHLRPATVDPEVAARRLGEVLELADALPRRPAARNLRYPAFPPDDAPR
ncbi:MAG: helix-turn-helix transcriptional regulator [Actinobacteria bacterium]|nr:helix-turn-helix transcriptional regulator [Actinomycetota bacterium]